MILSTNHLTFITIIFIFRPPSHPLPSIPPTPLPPLISLHSPPPFAISPLSPLSPIFHPPSPFYFSPIPPLTSLFSSSSSPSSSSSLSSPPSFINHDTSPLGLPFHSHGETWLGLVYGMKRWFLYPPGASQPISIERTHNPLRTVYQWFLEIYPQLQSLDQPPIHGELPVHQSANEGYRPLECVQMPGDIMYVPSGWNHLTLNIGELSIYQGANDGNKVC